MVPETFSLSDVLGKEWSGTLVYQAIGQESVGECGAIRVQVNAVGVRTSRNAILIFSGALYLDSETYEIIRAGAEVTHRYLIQISDQKVCYSALVMSSRTIRMEQRKQ
jgi:hypothetical protein